MRRASILLAWLGVSLCVVWAGGEESFREARASAAALDTTLALSAARPTPDSTPATCDSLSADWHRARAFALIDRGYALNRWESVPPYLPNEKRSWQAHRLCLNAHSARLRVSRHRDQAKAEWAAERRIRLLTPYPGGGTHWAIPYSIVYCESKGEWGAANPSGAIGPYQLLGHGAPWPVDSEADKLAHHRIASALWDGGAGRSAWVC